MKANAFAPNYVSRRVMRNMSAALTLALAACGPFQSNEAEQERDVETQPAVWIKLKDGSHIARISQEYPAIKRCWKTNMGYDCLTVFGREWLDAYRNAEPGLPRTISVLGSRSASHGEGYHCAIEGSGSGNYQEEVYNNKGEKLIEKVHTIMLHEDPMYKQEVESYLIDNGIRPIYRYFDCEAVSSVLQHGSLASIGTTSLTREMLK